MKFTLLLLSLISTTAFAKLVEDGSQFTGTYQTQEDECKQRVFNHTTGDIDLVDTLVLKGTPEGLVVNGALQPIQRNNMTVLLPNSGGTFFVDYVLPTEFFIEEVLHFEKSNVPVTHLFSIYDLQADGGLIVTNRRWDVPLTHEEKSICNFKRP